MLGYPDIAAAGDAVPDILPHHPIALEGIDDKLIGFEREKHLNPNALELFPKGAGFLLVQFGGDTKDEARQNADGPAAGAGPPP